MDDNTAIILATGIITFGITVVKVARAFADRRRDGK